MRVKLVAAACSGALLAAIHPGLAWAPAAPFALVPLLWSTGDVDRPGRRFLLGWLCGIVHWAAMCYWIQGTLNRHGGLSFLGALGVFVLFALAKGLHCGVFAALAGHLRARWAAPFLWVALERTHGPLGFPWLTLGDAGQDSGLAGLAPFTGVYGLSLVFALTSVLILKKKRWAAAVLLVFFFPPAPVADAPARALAVQPNFDEEAPPRDPQRTLFELSKTTEPVDLILWPEMPVGLYYQHDNALRLRLSELAATTRSGVIAGTVAFKNLETPLNSAQFIGPDGKAIARYDKMMLVPFGEYVPWPFNAIVEKVSTEAGTFSGGENLIAPQLGAHRTGVFICYESAFPHHVRAFVQQGAEVLVNLTNDGYFARSAARQQHLALARMRALENGRWILRPTNDGFTVAIDPKGQLHDQAKPYTAQAARLRFAYRADQTFYTATGDWLPLASSIAAAAFLLAARGSKASPPPDNPAAA